MHPIRKPIRRGYWARFIQTSVTLSDSSATFIHARCSVVSFRSSADTQRLHPKAQRFPHSFQASVGRINGHSGETVIPASWSPTRHPFRSEEHTSELQSLTN